jgi:Domain of unknown function (DUF4440)
VEALIDGMAARDRAAMLATLVPEGSVTHARGDQVTHTPLRQLPDRVPGGTATLDELLHDIEVRLDGDIAMLWARYDCYLDSEPHHWGTNIVTLVKQHGHWRICAITDNGHPGARPDP